MAGIGEYIHFQYKNYKTYGVNEPGGNKQSISTNIFTSMQNSILNKAKAKLGNSSKNKYQKLEAEMQAVMYGTDDSTSISKDAQRQRLISDIMLGEGVRFVENWAQGGMAYDSVYSENQKRFSPIKLSRLRASANNAIEILRRTTSVKKAEEKMAKLQKLVADIDTLAEQANIVWEKVNAGENPDTKQKNVMGREDIKISLNNINSDLEAIADASVTGAIGLSFEAFAASFDQSITNQSLDTAVHLVDTVLTGKGTETIKSNHPVSGKVTFNTNIDLAKIGFETTGTLKDSTYKMDVNLTYDDEQYRISAKNYKMDNGHQSVHLLNGSPFFNILQKNLGVSSINHLLNALTTKGKNAGLFKAASEVARTTIILEALMGLSKTQGYADYLLINNRSARRIQLRPIADLIPIDPTRAAAFKITGFNPEDFTDLNTYEGEEEGKKPNRAQAYKRIGRLLLKLHSIKLNASLNTNNWGWKN